MNRDYLQQQADKGFNKKFLHPEIWTKDNELLPGVEEKLLQMALEFASRLRIPKDHIIDVRVIGGAASYVWSNGSDMDVTILLDKEEGYDKTKIRKLGVKASNLNYKLRPMISDVETNFYISAGNVGSLRPATSVYSVAKRRFLLGPSRADESNSNFVVGKANAIAELIESALMDDSPDSAECLEELLRRLKRFRSKGLYGSEKGDNGLANMVWRLLSRSGYIGTLKSKIHSLKNDRTAPLLSVQELKDLAKTTKGLDAVPTSIVKLNTLLLKGGCPDEFIERADKVLALFKY